MVKITTNVIDESIEFMHKIIEEINNRNDWRKDYETDCKNRDDIQKALNIKKIITKYQTMIELIDIKDLQIYFLIQEKIIKCHSAIFEDDNSDRESADSDF